jgi:hypothetical protein
MINAFFVFLDSCIMMTGPRYELNKISPPARRNKWSIGEMECWSIGNKSKQTKKWMSGFAASFLGLPCYPDTPVLQHSITPFTSF